MLPRTLVVAGLALALGAPAATAATRCEDDPRYDALDPLVGEWRIVSDPEGDATVVGETTVGWILGGCVLEERRRLAVGERQRSWIVLEPLTGDWRQSWASSAGDSGVFSLQASDDGWSAEGILQLAGGDVVQVRTRLRPRPAGGWLEELEWTTDAWQTAERQRTAYLPLDADLPGRPPPAPSDPPDVAPAPAPTPAELAPAEPTPTAEDEAAVDEPSAPPATASTPAPEAEAERPGTVRIRSKVRREARVETVTMESPMVLEFELGPIDQLPAGSGWRTDELARYVTEEVNVPLVTAEQRRRRGVVRMTITVNLRTSAFQRRATVTVELIGSGGVAASATAGDVVVGKLIGSHDPKTGRPVPLDLELAPEAFDALFADGRPTLRLTVGIE